MVGTLIYEWMPAEPVRNHVRFLGANGISQARVCKIAGISARTLSYIIYGSAVRGFPPSRSVRADTYRRIMSISLDLDHVDGRGTVDATITRRKLEALCAMGWSKKYLGSRLGIARENTGLMFRRAKVSGYRARQIRDLFNELWDKRPERQDGYYYRLLRRAEERGFVTALAWNDIEDINEPQPKPYPLYRRSNRHTRDDAREDVCFLRKFGESNEQIAKRVHITVKTLEQEYA